MNDDDRPIESRLGSLGDALNEALDQRPLEPSGGRRAPAPHRLLAVAAAALVVAGGAGIWAVSTDADDPGATSSGVDSLPGPATVPGGGLVPTVPVTTSAAADPVVPPTTVLATTNTVVPPPTTGPIGPGSLLAVGDLVMKGASPALNDLGFVVNAEEGRQASAIVAPVPDLLAEQAVDVVVVHLGNNGMIAASDAETLMAAVADVPRVVVLTVVGDQPWIVSNNELIEMLPAQYPNVVVLPWDALARACPGDCFASDGIHLAADGARYYAGLIALVAGVDTEDAPSLPPTTSPEMTTTTVVVMTCPDGSEPPTYTLGPGDFRGGVAANLDVELDELEAANAGNPDWDRWYPGSVVYLPCD